MQNLRYWKFIDGYLEKLSILSGRTVSKADLSSIAEAQEMRKLSNILSSTPSMEITIDFDKYKSKFFSDLVNSMNALNPNRVAIWTDHTIDCGYVTVESIAKVNFSFEKHFSGENIFSFATIDMSDRMLIDFQQQGDSVVVQILLQGINWPETLRS